MATTEMSKPDTEGDQREKMLSPSEEGAPPVVDGTLDPINFSKLTPCQFGISVQSFTPAVASNRKDKSRLAQIKARRRSSVGVRGSPETNSLIRFIAQQRIKTPPTRPTPEHVRRSPFLPRVASTLREKMASFQRLMDEEESEVCDPMPSQDRNIGGCIKTRDYLSDESNIDGAKENHPPLMTPTPKKRRCLGPLEACEVQIREARAPILHFNLKEQEESAEPLKQVLTQRPLPSRETVDKTQAGLISPALHDEFQACTPTKKEQDDVFEVISPSQLPLDDPAAASPTRSAFSVIPSVSSLQEMKPTGEGESAGMSSVRRKKVVRFGGPLSPEFFDKNLPPSTPLQKGGTPARAPTPGHRILRSVLKTPQRSESKTHQAQPDLSSPTTFGASPTFAPSRPCSLQLMGEDSEEKLDKIVFPSMEEIDCAVMGSTEYTSKSQPLNLNTAFLDESLFERGKESQVKPSPTSTMDVLDGPGSLPEKEKQPEAAVEGPAQVRSSSRRKKPEPERESNGDTPARSSSRKRKQPEESEPAKRSTRSAAKLAAGKMKVTSTAARRWNRDVDRSLYGSREYASKVPALSPITERLSFMSQSPAVQQSPSTSCTGHEASNQETHLNPEMDKDTQVTGDLTVTHALGNPLVTSPNSNTDNTTGKGRKLPKQRVRGRKLKRKVSVARCDMLSEEPQVHTEGKTEEHCEDQATKSLEASGETPVTHTVPEQGTVIEPDVPTSANKLSTVSESGCHTGLKACSPSGEELNYTLNVAAEVTQRKAKQAKRSSTNSPAFQEQRDQMEEHPESHDVEESGQGDQAARHENNRRLSSGSQEEEGTANLNLAPWQSDFNFDDVFKPVTTRGQRSVRRSLRRQSEAGNSNSVGLAWLPWISPNSGKDARRKTRGRRLSAALPVQPSVPEETQGDVS